MTNELMVSGINVNALSNNNLKNNLILMGKAVQSANKSAWTYADCISNIFTGELYKDDFADKKTFAEKANISAGRVTQCCVAVQYRKLASLKEDDISLDNAYCIGSIKRKKEDGKGSEPDYVGFLKWMDTQGMDNATVYKLSNGQLKKYISEYKDERDNIVDGEVTKEETIDKKEDTKEATTIKMISSPWYTIGMHDGRYAIVMHHVTGEDEVKAYEYSENGLNEMMRELNSLVAGMKKGLYGERG